MDGQTRVPTTSSFTLSFTVAAVLFVAMVVAVIISITEWRRVYSSTTGTLVFTLLTNCSMKCWSGDLLYSYTCIYQYGSMSMIKCTYCVIWMVKQYDKKYKYNKILIGLEIETAVWVTVQMRQPRNHRATIETTNTLDFYSNCCIITDSSGSEFCQYIVDAISWNYRSCTPPHPNHRHSPGSNHIYCSAEYIPCRRIPTGSGTRSHLTIYKVYSVDDNLHILYNFVNPWIHLWSILGRTTLAFSSGTFFFVTAISACPPPVTSVLFVDTFPAITSPLTTGTRL